MSENKLQTNFDVICFSHLRWDFVFQRPQHLMTRFARDHRVIFFEEPIFYDGPSYLDATEKVSGLTVCQPRLAEGTERGSMATLVAQQLQEFLADNKIDNYIHWFYTPMMMNLAEGLSPRATIYDCMDELSAFRGAPPELCERERALMDKADLVFTGGQSLFEAKRSKHASVYPFPSSVDVSHFSQAEHITDDHRDQESIPHPRIGFAGVIDERLDIDLLGRVAELQPDRQFVMIGPVVKISESDLPRRENIHYLGMRPYEELPAFLAGWDVAMMPFALNESTKFISPTKTPEYLAAGLPVVSTAITDVVHPYGDLGLVHIAASAEEFSNAIQAAINEDALQRMIKAGELLSQNSWDKTFQAMSALIEDAIGKNTAKFAAAV